jgi:hypothetical protein
MNVPKQKSDERHAFRVDSFVVPVAVRDEFLRRVLQTQAVLRAQDGFVQNVILERVIDEQHRVLVTIVEWRSATVLPHAREAVATLHKRLAFHPLEFMARSGITALAFLGSGTFAA